MRRSALLNAGRELALEHGGRQVTMAAVAARSGLSRPAVYEYFDSTEALLSELAVVELAAWTEEIGTAVERAKSPTDKVRAYIRASLAYIASGRHDLADAIGDAVLPEIVAQEIAAMHRRTQAADRGGPGRARLPRRRPPRRVRPGRRGRGRTTHQGRGQATQRDPRLRGLRPGRPAARAVVPQRRPVPRRSASRTSRSTSSG